MGPGFPALTWPDSSGDKGQAVRQSAQQAVAPDAGPRSLRSLGPSQVNGGVDRDVLLWGSLCHHVKREASRFIRSTLSSPRTDASPTARVRGDRAAPVRAALPARRLYAPAARSAGADRVAQRTHPPAPVSPAPVPRRPGPRAQLRSAPGPPPEPGRRARRGPGAKPFASRAPERSLLRCRKTGKTLMGGPDAAGVRGRRSAVQPRRRPTPYRGRLPRWAQGARSP